LLAKKLFPGFFPKYLQGHERCYPWARVWSKFGDRFHAGVPSTLQFIMMRSPRAHVWSQYHHCQAHRQLWPNAEPGARDALRWLASFASPNATNDFATCYDPRDMSTRALTCHGISSHQQPSAVSRDSYDYAPQTAVDAALRSLHSLDFVRLHWLQQPTCGPAHSAPPPLRCALHCVAGGCGRSFPRVNLLAKAEHSRYAAAANVRVRAQPVYAPVQPEPWSDGRSAGGALTAAATEAGALTATFPCRCASIEP
jgi:hypothetical protein